MLFVERHVIRVNVKITLVSFIQTRIWLARKYFHYSDYNAGIDIYIYNVLNKTLRREQTANIFDRCVTNIKRKTNEFRCHGDEVMVAQIRRVYFKSNIFSHPVYL